MGELWVGVVFLRGDDYAEVADMGVDEMVEHMAQWDCGRETDFANTRTGAPWGSADRTYEVTVGGIRYVLAVNHATGYASLNRRPLARARPEPRTFLRLLDQSLSPSTQPGRSARWPCTRGLCGSATSSHNRDVKAC